MKLSLSVISYKDQPPDQPFAIVLNHQEIRIGRAKDNGWILPDKERFVSSHHATIEYRDQNYRIIDTSTNGVFLNHSSIPLGEGNSARLKDGDHLVIGEYEIAVVLIEKDAEDETSTLSTTSTINGVVSFSPFEEFDSEAALSGSFEEYNSEAASSGPFEEHDSNVLDRVIEENALIPDAIDIEDEPASEPASQHVSPLDEAFPLPIEEPESQSPQIEPERQAPDSEFKIPEDWFGEGDSLPEEQLEKDTPFQPEMKEEAAEQIAKPKLPVSDTLGNNGNLYFQALEQFLDGVELNDPTLKETMESNAFQTIGKLFRTAIKGARDLLMARAEIKNEMRLDATSIRPAENNPLKFSSNVDDALTRLLQPDNGCMPPEQAISEAFDDLRAHQIAVLAGMQTALKSLLKRFDPEVLEHRLQESNPISASIPIHKRAKLWNLFEQLHEEIENEAEDNFYHLFGQAFAKAYEEQIRNLHATDNHNL